MSIVCIKSQNKEVHEHGGVSKVAIKGRTLCVYVCGRRMCFWGEKEAEMEAKFRVKERREEGKREAANELLMRADESIAV